MVIAPIIERRSVRFFKPDEVSDEQVSEIIKAGQYAPTANNNRSIEYLVIKSQQLRDSIYAAIGQRFLREAPIVLCLVIDPAKSVCPVQDLSCASENIFIQATAMGLGTIWKNISEEQEPRIKKLLNIPDNLRIINLIPIGYPSEKPLGHTGFDKDKIRIDTYKEIPRV